MDETDTGTSGGWAPMRGTANVELADAWALVLESQGISHHLHPGPAGAGLVLWVPEPERERAARLLEVHDRERRAEAATVYRPPPDQGRSAAGLAMVAVLAAFYWVAGGREDGDPGRWFREGTAVADRILRGELYRSITALTLHADLAHLFGNAVATLIFVTAVGRWVGSGLGLLATLATGALGNFFVALSHGHHHSSVGASTATFGALGLLGGLQIIRWTRPGHGMSGRRQTMAVIAACLGVFAMLGVGERSDVRAHLFGLGAGLLIGMALGRWVPLPMRALWSHLAGALAAALVAGAWALALR